jgi:hypothetical protein
MRKIILLFSLMLLLSAFNIANAQISVSSYSIYALGVQTPIGSRFAFECKLFPNSVEYLQETRIEPTFYYTFRERTYHRFAAGLGYNFNFYGDISYITMPVQLEIFPLMNFKKLSIIIELGLILPYAEPQLRHLWGIRYKFGAD